MNRSWWSNLSWRNCWCLSNLISRRSKRSATVKNLGGGGGSSDAVAYAPSSGACTLEAWIVAIISLSMDLLGYKASSSLPNWTLAPIHNWVINEGKYRPSLFLIVWMIESKNNLAYINTHTHQNCINKNGLLNSHITVMINWHHLLTNKILPGLSLNSQRSTCQSLGLTTRHFPR